MSANENEIVETNLSLLSLPIPLNNNNDQRQPNPDLLIGSKWPTYRAFAVQCIAVLFHYTAMSVIQLQTSLNSEANVGVNSLIVFYTFLIISALILPSVIIAMLGLKWTIVLAQIPYMLYVASNYIPSGYFMYPAAALVGLGGPPFWIASSTYLTELGASYAKYLGKPTTTSIVSRFFSIFFVFYQSAQVVGDLVSYFVLKPEQLTEHNVTNTSLLLDSRRPEQKCGAAFNDREYKKDIESIGRGVNKSTVHLLCHLYVICGVISFLILLFFLPNRRKAKDTKTLKKQLQHNARLSISTIKHLRHVDQFLLIPLTLWSGLQEGFFIGQFTEGFIFCLLKVRYVGLIHMTYCLSGIITNLLFSTILKPLSRPMCFSLAAIVNFSLIFFMLFWKPNRNNEQDIMMILFLISIFWGISHAVWSAQITALYGSIFSECKEAAFSCQNLFICMGTLIFFLLTPNIRIRWNLIILLVALSNGMIGYLIAEFRWNKCKRKTILPTTM